MSEVSAEYLPIQLVTHSDVPKEQRKSAQHSYAQKNEWWGSSHNMNEGVALLWQTLHSLKKFFGKANGRQDIPYCFNMSKVNHKIFLVLFSKKIKRRGCLALIVLSWCHLATSWGKWWKVRRCFPYNFDSHVGAKTFLHNNGDGANAKWVSCKIMLLVQAPKVTFLFE